MKVKVTMDRRQIDRFLREAPGQAKFAVSLAINETLKVAQKDQRARQRSVFEVRNTRFVDQAVKIKPFAKKSALFSVIQIEPPGGAARADIIDKFERGGRKLPRGRSIAVPGRTVRRGRGGVSGALRPAAAIASGRAFEARTRRGKRVILERLGSGKRTRLKVLYLLTPSARIDRRLGFVDTITAAINRVGERELVRAWTRATATAR